MICFSNLCIRLRPETTMPDIITIQKQPKIICNISYANANKQWNLLYKICFPVTQIQSSFLHRSRVKRCSWQAERPSFGSRPILEQNPPCHKNTADLFFSYVLNTMYFMLCFSSAHIIVKISLNQYHWCAFIS